jgi:hypothetical protein
MAAAKMTTAEGATAKMTSEEKTALSGSRGGGKRRRGENGERCKSREG